MPQASANALQKNRSMLTLINKRFARRFLLDAGRRRSVSLSLPACFRGRRDSGLVRKRAFSLPFYRKWHDLPPLLPLCLGGRTTGRVVNFNGQARSFEHVYRPSCRRTRPSRARTDQTVSPRFFSADRIQLPTSTDLLGLRRRSGCSLRRVGRRLDDAGAALPLSPVRHLGARLRAFVIAASRALVSPLALWSLARHLS
jgi:hypothetical protein